MIGDISYRIFENTPQISCRTVWASDSRLSRETGAEDYLTFFISPLTNNNIHENRFVFAQQVHGTALKFAGFPGILKGCDGMYSIKCNLNLVIRTADCASVMVFVPPAELIMNLHVGWRGAFAGIVPQGIALISREYKVSPAKFLVAVSPFIRSCCYEVGSEFSTLFPPAFLNEREGKLFFDLERFIVEQLLQAGLREENLEISEHCTSCSSLILPSYRRDKTPNRLLNMIELKEV